MDDTLPLVQLEPLNGKILLLGYGNPGRQDDGLGPAAADAIAELKLPHVHVEVNYQLNIEDGAAAAEHDIVLFVDAAECGPEPFSVREVIAADDIAFSSHVVPPGVVLAISQRCFGKFPRGILIAIRGYEFELLEGLTPTAEQNLKAAIEFLCNAIAPSVT